MPKPITLAGVSKEINDLERKITIKTGKQYRASPMDYAKALGMNFRVPRDVAEKEAFAAAVDNKIEEIKTVDLSQAENKHVKQGIRDNANTLSLRTIEGLENLFNPAKTKNLKEAIAAEEAAMAKKPSFMDRLLGKKAPELVTPEAVEVRREVVKPAEPVKPKKQSLKDSFVQGAAQQGRDSDDDARSTSSSVALTEEPDLSGADILAEASRSSEEQEKRKIKKIEKAFGEISELPIFKPRNKGVDLDQLAAKQTAQRERAQAGLDKKPERNPLDSMESGTVGEQESTNYHTDKTGDRSLNRGRDRSTSFIENMPGEAPKGYAKSVVGEATARLAQRSGGQSRGGGGQSL